MMVVFVIHQVASDLLTPVWVLGGLRVMAGRWSDGRQMEVLGGLRVMGQSRSVGPTIRHDADPGRRRGIQIGILL